MSDTFQGRVPGNARNRAKGSPRKPTIALEKLNSSPTLQTSPTWLKPDLKLEPPELRTLPQKLLREMSPAEIQQIYENYTLHALEAVCKGRGVTVEAKLNGTNRLKYVAALAAVFNDKASIDQALARLSPAAYYGLALIKRANGIVNRAEWRQRMGIRFGDGQDQAEQELVGLALAVYGMRTTDGLILSASGARQSVGKPGFYDAWIVAFPPVLDRFMTDSELQKFLQPVLPTLYQEQNLSPATPANFEFLLKDLFSFLRYLESGSIKLLQSGDLGKRDFGKLYALMSVKDSHPWANAGKISDLPRLNLLWHLLLTTGMVAGQTIARGELAAQVQPEKVAEFFALPRHLQARVLTMAWIDSQYNEFLNIPTLDFINTDSFTSDVPLEVTLTKAREYVMRLLETLVLRHHLPPGEGQWVDLPVFQSFVQELNLELLVSRQNRPTLYSYSYSSRERNGFFGDTYYNGFTSQFKRKNMGWGNSERPAELDKDWKLVEGEWLTHLFREPLNWLGLAELGMDQTGQPIAWSLTGLGIAVLLGDNLVSATPGVPSGSVEAERSLIVQPNFEVLALAPLQHMSVLHQLDRFATQESLGEVARYRINKESMLKGLRTGLNGAQILKFLNENSRVPLSQNLIASIEDWNNSFDRLHLRPTANLLEVADPAVLDRLMASPTETTLIERRLSPTLALLKSEAGELGKASNNKNVPVAITSRTSHGNAPALTLEALISENTPASGRFQQALLTVDYQEIKAGSIQFENERGLKVKAGHSTPYLNYRLGQFADLVSWEANRQSALFELSYEAGQRAQGLGLTYQAVTNFLGQWSGQRTIIPAAMQLILKNWLGYYPALESYRTLSLKAASPEQLNDLFSLTEFAPLLVERASPRLALIREDLLPQYQERLAALGVVIVTAHY